MRVVEAPLEFRSACHAVRAAGRTIGLVPTMGALHDGHLSLVQEARRRTDAVAVTIFVNPTQFGPGEDLPRYPRDLDGDLDKCRGAGVDLVFTPRVGAMYAEGDETRVHVGELQNGLCGASRPKHFEGVCTVVSKLFLLCGPATAVFGRKDYQQWKIIERMAADLFLPIEVVGAPLIREQDGLAMSSRNGRLSPEERKSALGLARGLRRAQLAFVGGVRDVRELEGIARDAIVEAELVCDYATLADPQRLTRFGAAAPERALLAVAAFASDVRLIDNVVLGEDPVVEVV